MRAELELFAKQHKFRQKGALSIALVITDQVKRKNFPLKAEDFLAKSGTQVSGSGGPAVQAILKRNNIDRVLASEGGRTSRGSVAKMEAYVAFLNEQHAAKNLDFAVAEKFWLEKVNEYFAGKPFTLKISPHFGLRAVIRNLLEQAEARQEDGVGTRFVGTVMQHLVGAKLEIVLGEGSGIEHHHSNQSDQKSSRTGDFDIGDVSIHVSNAPSEALIQKCKANIDAGLKPIIITSRKGSLVAEGLADNASIGASLDIIEFEQFMATNVHELGRFEADRRRIKIEEIVDKYNNIIEQYETDPSLAIEVATGKS